MPKSPDGQQVGDLWADEANVTSACYERSSLRFADNPQVEVYRDAGGKLRQLLCGETMVDLVDIADGFEVRYYPSLGTLPATVPSGTPYRSAWRVDNPDGSGIYHRVRVSKLIPDPTSPGNGTVVPGSEVIYTDNGSAGLSLAKPGLGTETKSVVEHTDTGHKTTTWTTRNPQNVILSQRVEESAWVQGEDGAEDGYRLLTITEGLAGEQRVSNYSYHEDGSHTVTRLLNGVLESMELIGASGNGDQRPFKSTPSDPAAFATSNLGVFSSNDPSSSYRAINGIPVSTAYTSTYNWVEMLPDPAAPESLIAVNVKQRVTNSNGQYASVSSYADDAPALYAGKTSSSEDAGGTSQWISYEQGSFDGWEFFPWDGGSMVQEVTYHIDYPVGIPYNQYDRGDIRLFDSAGNLVVERIAAYQNGYVTEILSETWHTYDEAGHLVETNRDGRVSYSASWQNGHKVSEIDDAGVKTSYSIFDAEGRPLHTVRDNLEAAGSLSAIPALSTDVLYDALGRKTTETSTDGTNTTTREWSYDSLGRLKWEKLNGVTTSSFAYEALKTTRTLPGGFNEITETYLDGQTKSITGTAVLPQAFDYGVNLDGKTWSKVSKGGGDTPIWTLNTADRAGHVIRREKSGTDGTIMHEFTYNGELLTSETSTGMSPISYDENWATSVQGYPAKISTRTRSAGGSDGTRNTSRAEYYYWSYASWGFSLVREDLAPGGGVVSTAEQAIGFWSGLVSYSRTDGPGGFFTETLGTLNAADHSIVRTTTQAGMNHTATSISRLGLIQSVTSFSGGTPTRYSYDGFGRQTAATDPRTNAVTMTSYDPLYGQVATVTGPGMAVSHAYYSPTEAFPGRLKSRTVNGQTTYYSYDGLGHQTKTWGQGVYPTWQEYDGNGRPWKLHTYRQGDESLWMTATWPAGAGEGDVTTTSYWPGTELVRTKLDAAGQGTSYTYWPSGLLKTRAWARGITTTYGYTLAGELKTVDYSDATPDVTLSYNDFGQVIGRTDAAGAHVLAYSSLGLLASDTISGGLLPGVRMLTNEDGYGRWSGVAAWMNNAPLGAAQSYSYNAATGRMATASDGTNTVTYGYLPNSDWLATATFTRTGVSGNTLVQTRTPDSANRLASVVTTRGGTTVESHAWTYDSVGRRSADTLASSEGTRWDYGYNGRNEVTSGQRKLVSGNVPLAGYQFAYGYDPIGNRRSTTVNGRYASYTANALNQYTARDVPPAVDVLGTAAADAVVTVSGPQGAVVADKAGTRFAAEVPVDNTLAPQYPSVSVEAKRVTGTGAGTVTKSTQSGHLFVAKQPEVFAYDLDGNTTSDGRWNYTWDGENRLSSAETLPAAVSATVPRQRLEFAYDAQGRRIRTLTKSGWNGSTYATTTTRRFIYGVGWNLLAELDAGTNVQRRCLWGLDLSGSLTGAGGIGGLLVENIAGTDYLPCYDGNGNLTALIKASDGSEAARYQFGPFGELLRMTGAVAETNRFRWSTKYTDEIGVYYGHRYLKDGRWLNRDPVGERGGENIYAFVYNAPAYYIDNTGEQPASDPKPGPLPAPDPIPNQGGYGPLRDSSHRMTITFFSDATPIESRIQEAYSDLKTFEYFTPNVAEVSVSGKIAYFKPSLLIYSVLSYAGGNAYAVPVTLSYNDAKKTVDGQTNEGHMLVGSRSWQIERISGCTFGVTTSASEKSSNWLNEQARNYGGGDEMQKEVWTRYLQNIGNHWKSKGSVYTSPVTVK